MKAKNKIRVNKTDIVFVNTIARYLDGCIIFWRAKKRSAETDEDKIIASCYVDAYQSARISLLGELLPLPEESPMRNVHTADITAICR
jgi:hypothetical protein